MPLSVSSFSVDAGAKQERGAAQASSLFMRVSVGTLLWFLLQARRSHAALPV